MTASSEMRVVSHGGAVTAWGLPVGEGRGVVTSWGLLVGEGQSRRRRACGLPYTGSPSDPAEAEATTASPSYSLRRESLAPANTTNNN
ncbi:hypothetical protein GUJ93_ZPchr0008g14126 [Zizania palustris]|uniref:Uncharacterized protein n=1 Tax=Zizania palustris TaxID=103762 RepID=A0A8J5RFI4_ZIZPA|nr:hypothetical protein GUJ93_ZPchr0008g14126 [Zizania palustris]